MTLSVNPASSLYRRLLAYVRPYWKAFVLAIATMVVTAATEPLFPALMKPMLDKGFNNAEHNDLYLIPLAIIGIFLVRGVFGYIASYLMSWVSNRVICDLRQAMFERIVRLPTGYLHDNPSSRLITRVASDVNGVASASTSVISTLLRDSLSVVGLLVWLLYLNWKLTLLMSIIAPVMAFVTRKFSKRLRKTSQEAQAVTAHMLQVLQETIEGHKVVKIYGGETQEINRFSRINNELRRYGVRQTVAAAASVPIVQLFASIAVALVVYVALLQSSSNQTTVGGFVSFITAMLMLLAPLKHLADINAPLQRGLAAAESVFTLLDEKPEDDSGSYDLGRAKGALHLDQVRFRYPGVEKEALAGVSHSIAPGQTVALVGPSGSGKTTLANLLPRFYHPTAGTIAMDSRDLETVTLASLRRNIALVSQDVVLFDDTVAANIAYGSGETVTRSEVEAAAQAAYAHDFIMAMPQGYDTPIGENGVRLSGGQRQRLAIARALLKDAPLLILDEATSALDSESERQVQAALERLMENRTTLVIAHRLSTIERADIIVVMEQGQVVEQGSHTELLGREGLYAKLYRMQYALEHTQ